MFHRKKNKIKTNPITITRPAFEVPEETLTLKEIKWHAFNRIGFRGDDRSPDIIFNSGFVPMETNNSQDSIYVKRPLESVSEKVIAFSTRFNASIFFPYDAYHRSPKLMWVYVVKPNKAFNVHQHGYESQIKKGLSYDTALALFADELITDHIPTENIIMAVKIFRRPYQPNDKKPDYLNQNSTSLEEKLFRKHLLSRGKYVIGGYQINDKCTLPEEDIHLAENFIRAEQNANMNNIESASQIGIPPSGFAKSSRK